MLKRDGRLTKEKTLREEIRKGFAIIIATIALLIIAIVIGMVKIGDASNAIGDTNRYIVKLYQAQAAHYKWSMNLLCSLNYDMEFTGSLDPTACDFGKFIYSEDAHSEGFHEFLEKIEPIHNTIHRTADLALEAAGEDKDEAEYIYLEAILPNLENLVGQLGTYIDEKNNEVAELRADFTIVVIGIGLICLVVVIFLVIFCMKLDRFLRKEVIFNLGKLVDETKQLSEGKLNLDFSVDCTTTDIQELSNSLDFAVNELSRYIQAVDYCMEEFSKGNLAVECPTRFIGDFEKIETSITEFSSNISHTLDEVIVASNQVASGADQISGGAQELSFGATQQANGVEELSATITDITEKISTTAKNVKGIHELMIDTCDMVTVENSKMKEMTDAMTEITQKSVQVKEIIKTINAITSQTNILSLNAAIEAARAGSSGKGFAVVADEVRNLAQSSSEAAKEIEALIEDTISAVNHGSRIAAEAEAILEKILKRSMEINEKVDEVALVSSEQAEGMEQISLGVDHISSVVQTTSATSQESAAASEELLAQAQLLYELTQQFKIKSKVNMK